MEQESQNQRSRAKLRYLVNCTRETPSKRQSSAARSTAKRSWMCKTDATTTPAEYSAIFANNERFSEFNKSAHAFQGQCITEPSVVQCIRHICGARPLTPAKQCKEVPKPKLRQFCQERRDVIELSKWIADRMESLKKEQNFDLSTFVDYRQFVVNVALHRLLGLIRNYSVEAAELMSELWTKTFGFMQFLLTQFSKDRGRFELSIASLEREREELHVSYLERLRNEQQELRGNLQQLKSDFRANIILGRQLKKKCALLTRTLRDEKYRSNQFEEALIRSLHIGMQFASGDHLQWSHRVFNSLYKMHGKSRSPTACTEQVKEDSNADEVIRRHLQELERQRQCSNWGYTETEEYDQPIGYGWDGLTVGQILQISAPQDIYTSTTDLHPLKEAGVQNVAEMVHQVSNTRTIIRKETEIQTKSSTRDIHTQTNDTGKSRLRTPKNARQTQVCSIPAEHRLNSKDSLDIPKPDNSIERRSSKQIEKLFSISGNVTGFTNSRLNSPISKLSSKAGLRIQQPAAAPEIASNVSIETGEKLQPNMSFSQIYSHNKRKLLENKEQFKQGLVGRRSFTNLNRVYNPVRRDHDIAYIELPIAHQQQHQRITRRIDRWGQDILAQEKIWQHVLRTVKQSVTSPASVSMATASLFRIFSQIIQSLCRAYKFNSSQPKHLKGAKTSQRRRLQPLKYVLMRRLGDSMRMQLERELKQIVNNLMFLRRTKELEMFSMLMGLSQGYQEVGANELELYVRTFALLDASDKFQVERELRTTGFLLSEHFEEITEDFFEDTQRQRMLQRLLKNDGQNPIIDEIARTLVRRYTERKRLSYDSYEYLFEGCRYFRVSEMENLIRHLNLSLRVKSVMLREFVKLLDCRSSGGRYISYERFWMFCERVGFPSRSALLDLLQKRPKAVNEFCEDSPERAVEMLIANNIRIPPLLTSVLQFLQDCTSPTKTNFWIQFVIFFCGKEVLEQRILRYLPSQLEMLQTINLNICTADSR